MRILLLTFFLSLILTSYPQQVNIDSLIQVVQTAPDDSNKVIAYRSLCGALGNEEPVKAIPYGRKGAALAKKIGWDKGVAGCYLNLGNAYLNIGEFDTGLVVNDSALIYAKRVGEPGRIALVYINIAAAHIYLGNLEQAMNAALDAMPYAEASKNQDRIARVYLTMGNIEYYQEHWGKALDYFQKCTPIFQELEVEYMVGTCYMNMGVCYKNLNNLKQAENYTNRSIGIFKKLTDNERLIIAYSNLGSILRSKQDYKNAERCLKTAIDLTLKVGDKEQEIFNKQSLADVYYLQGNYVLARQILLPLLDQAKEHQYYEELGNTALTLYSVEKAMGNFENAVAYLEVYNMAQDTLENRMEQTQLLALQEKYAAEEKAKEIELLSKDAELNDRKIEQQRIVIASITGLFLLVVIVLALLIGRFRMNRQVKELQLRNRLALDLHDEVGSSLSSIKMLSEMAVKQKENREIVQRIAGNARETVDRMGDIIWMINPKYDHFIDLKKRMEMYLEDICLHKNIQHAFLDKLPETIQLSMQQRKNLLLVFKEAVNNAAKYSGANFIQVNIYMREDNVVLEVIDNGKGFDMLSIVKGNGLTSMELRANELHGQIKVQSEYNKGTSILLSFKA